MSYNYTKLSTAHEEILTEQLELPLLNVTRGLPVQYVVVLFGYITPVFFVITVVANIMIVLVLSRPDMRTPTNLVLLAMAVADLLTLVFPVPWYFYMYTLGQHTRLLHPAILCNLYLYMSEVLPAFFHTASIWCTLLLACQRYIYICHPSVAKIWCTNKRVGKVIGTIFALAFVHQLLRFFDRHYEDFSQPARPESSSSLSPNVIYHGQQACLLVMSDWVVEVENVYFVSYFIFRIIFVHIGPCLALVIFNVLLYSALKRAELTRSKLFLKSNASKCGGPGSSPLLKNGQGQRSQSLSNGNEQVVINENVSRRSICIEARKGNRGLGSGRDANSTTFMLIVVVTVFLIVEIPLAITTAVHVTENVFELELVSDRLLNMTIIFSNFFIIISYPLNFAIYCGMSRAFRETFQQIFIRRIVDNSTAVTTTFSMSIGSSNSKRGKHSGKNNSDQSKQQPSDNQPDLESAASLRTSDSSPLTERISRTEPSPGGGSTRNTITDRNGLTQLVSATAVCETML